MECWVPGDPCPHVVSKWIQFYSLPLFCHGFCGVLMISMFFYVFVSFGFSFLCQGFAFDQGCFFRPAVSYVQHTQDTESSCDL